MHRSPTADCLDLLENAWQECRDGGMRALFFQAGDGTLVKPGLETFLKGPQAAVAEVMQVAFGVDLAAPYAPFLDSIIAVCAERSEAERGSLLDTAGVYRYLKPVLAAHLSGEPVTRHEETLPEERAFERRALFGSLRRLFLKAHAGRPLIVVMENLQAAPPSTIDLLADFARHPAADPLLLVFIFDPGLLFSEEGAAEPLADLPTLFRERGFVVEIPGSVVARDESGQTAASQTGPDGLLDRAERALSLLAFRDCLLLLHSSGDAPGTLGDSTDPSALRKHRLLGEASIGIGDYNNALLYANTRLSIALHGVDALEICDAHRLLGLICLERGDLQGAGREVENCLRIAERLGNERALFYALFLQFRLEDKGSRQPITDWRGSYLRLLELARRLKMENSLAYFLTNPYGLYSSYGEADEVRHREGVAIAEGAENLHRLAAAFQLRGLIHAVKGEYDQVIDCYRRSLEIKQQMDNQLELAYVHNGLGFYQYLRGDFCGARAAYRTALDLLRHDLDFLEVAQTLYNLAVNAWLAFAFDEAAVELDTLLSLLAVLQVPQIAYHSRFGIYCLAALIACQSGRQARAREFLTRIRLRRLRPFPRKNEEFFMYFLLRALLETADGSRRALRAAGWFLRQTNDVIKYLAPRYHYEAARLAEGRGDAASRDEALAACWTVADNLGFSAYRALVSGGETCLIGRPVSLMPAEPPRGDGTWIIEAARREQGLVRLRRRVGEINLLHGIATLSGHHRGSAAAFLNSVLRRLANGIPADLICLAFRTAAGWERQVPPGVSSVDLPAVLLDRLAEQGRDCCLEENDPLWQNMPGGCACYTRLLCLPLADSGRVTALLLCANDIGRSGLVREDLKVLSIAARQIAGTLETIKQQDEIVRKNLELEEAIRQLAKSAETDMLTGACNRNALSRRLEEERDRLVRYRRPGDCPFSILFIDMDNFKYYNDNFGHRVGDLLIREMAGLLHRLSRTVDCVGRYGGDEFVLFLPETDAAGAAGIAERIRRELLGAANFLPLVEEALGHPVHVPDAQRLSCSIGIAEFDPASDDIDSLLAHADEALYRVKQRGKDGFEIHQARQETD